MEIQISKNEINLIKYDYDYKAKEHKQIIRPLTEDNVIVALSAAVSIDDNVELIDLIKQIDANELLTNIISDYNHCDAKAHNKFTLSEPDPDNADKYDNIEAIEIEWDARLFGDNLDMWATCHGLGKVETNEHRPDGRERYALDLSPSNGWARKPLKLNEECTLYLIEYEEHKIKNNGVILDQTERNHYVSGYKSFNFIEFLNAIYEEMSFFGSPDSEYRQHIKDELKNAIEDFDDQKNNGQVVPFTETKDGKQVFLSDQVRGFLGLPSNTEDRDEQIRKSSEDNEF